MIIIIPLGGIGKRFTDFGYEMPKPLIRAHGKEIILRVVESFKLIPSDKIYIVYNEILDQYGFKDYFIHHKNIFLYKLEKNTKGPVETINQIIKIIRNSSKDESLLLADGDTFYNKNILNNLRKKENPTIIFSKTRDKNPIYSYIKTKNNIVSEIKEKERISNKFNVGSYYFNNMENYYVYSKKVLNKNRFAYISNVYAEMIKDKLKIDSIEIQHQDFVCLGTPKQLIDYCVESKQEKRRFCFDLDNTLVTLPAIKGDYSTVKPIYQNIKLLRYLKKNNHYVIIYTARRMKTFNSNVIKVKKNIYNMTKNQLRDFQIPYDELIVGKPYADFYIDDLAINSFDNLNFKLGYYDLKDSESRVFNDVVVGENFTIKKSTNIKKISNEIKYFKKLPSKLKRFFPKIISNGNNWYKMETIKGIQFSYLIENNLLQNEHIDRLLYQIEYIHKFKTIKNSKNFYQNYNKKFNLRVKLINPSLIKKNLKHINYIKMQIHDYVKNDRGKISIIHGDPVFSNIHLKEENEIIFLDPRGGQLNNFSLYGDLFYDYAKIYQSLYGYEFIISRKIPIKKLKQLREYFEIKFLDKFGKDKIHDLKILCSSLFLTLIPFHHENLSKIFICKSKEISPFKNKI